MMRSRVLLRLLAPLSAVVMFPMAVDAAEMRSGNEVLIPSGSTISDDLYVAGGQVTIEGNVQGDLIAAGGTVTVRGNVTGDIIVAGGNVRVDGRAGHSIRAAGGDVVLAGPVGKDMVAFAGTLKTLPTLAVTGETYAGGGNVHLGGQLGRTLQANAGSLQLDGQVSGPARLQAPTLQVGKGAVIGGDLSLATSSANPVAQGARVQGEVVTNVLERHQEGGGLAGWTLGFLMALTVGLTLLWLSPKASDDTSTEALRAPGWRMLAGLLALIGAPVVAALMMVTVIGIPLGVLLLVGYAVSLYLAQLVIAWSAGRTLFGFRHIPLDSFSKRAGALALGLLIVYLARAIPFLGPLVTLVVLVWGVGAMGTLAYRWFRSHYAASASVTTS